MRIHPTFLWPLVTWTTLLFQTTLAASVFIPATSPLFQYDQGWKNGTSDPSIMTTTNNGSFYFMFRGPSFSIHFSPLFGGDAGLWFNGNQRLDLSTLYRTGATTQSSYKPGMVEYSLQSSDEDHQIHFSYAPVNTSDIFELGGITIGTSGDAYVPPNMYGVSATVAPSNRFIMDNTALTYSPKDWQISNNSSFAYGRTLASTNVVGANVSLTFTQDVSNLWLFGTLSRQGATLNITFPSGNQITSLNNYGISRPYLNDSLVQVMLWSPGQMSVTRGSTMNITLTGGTFDLDFILYSTPSTTNGDSWGIYTTVIVIGSVFTVFCLSALAFWRYKRIKKRKKSRKLDRKGVLSAEIDDMPMRSPRGSISPDDLSLNQPPLTESVGPPNGIPPAIALRTTGLPIVNDSHQPSPHYMLPSPAYMESTPTSSLPTSGLLNSALGTQTTPTTTTTPHSVSQIQAGSEALPEWSPPPPSYLTVSELVSEARRGMIPLDQETLERLFERVMALRREGRSSALMNSGSALRFHANPTPGTIVEETEEEVDDLEALARRIAGIETMPSPTPLGKR